MLRPLLLAASLGALAVHGAHAAEGAFDAPGFDSLSGEAMRAGLQLLPNAPQQPPKMSDMLKVWIPHGNPGAYSATCPKGVNLADGCIYANPYASFQQANFEGAATLSGQSWTAPCPQGWNLAGVGSGCGYPVGYNTLIALMDPAVSVLLPPGAAYQPTGSGGNPQVKVSSVTNLDLEYFDFSGSSGSTGKCTVLSLAATVGGGTVKIANNRFGQADNSCSTNLELVQTLGCPSATNYIFSDNEIDGNGLTYPNNFTEAVGLDCPYAGSTALITRNAVLDVPSRPFQVTVGQPARIIGNYIRNINAGYATHGEVMIQGVFAGFTTPTQIDSYNTVLWNNLANSNTTTFYCSRAANDGTVFAKCQIDHNTIVANNSTATTPTGNPGVSALIVENAYNNVTEEDIFDNYYDIGGLNSSTGLYGTFDCAINTGPVTIGTLVQYGNVSLQNGVTSSNLFQPAGTVGKCK